MAAVFDKVNTHVKNNQYIYKHPANWVTLAMWAIALSSHAILIPLFIREVVLNKKPERDSLFGKN